jgi:hypothetical protein
MARPAAYYLLNVLAVVLLVGACAVIVLARPGEQTFDMVRRGVQPPWDAMLLQGALTGFIAALFTWAVATIVGLLADIRAAAEAQADLARAQLTERATAKAAAPPAPPPRARPPLVGDHVSDSMDTPAGRARVGDRVWDTVMTEPVTVVSFLSASSMVVRRANGDPFALEARYVVKIEPGS